MQQPQQQATLVFEAPDSRYYFMLNNTRQRVSSGPVKLCWLDDAKVYFIMVDTFCQNLFPNTPIVTIQSQKGITLLFPHLDQGLNGIFIPGDPAPAFCGYLVQIIQLIPFQSAIQIPQFKTTIDLHCKDIQQNPLENDIEAIGYIQKGGEAAKQGFMWMGEKLASGINSGGQYINSKIDKQEKVQVSTETKVKYEVAKQTASQGLTVTGQYLSQLFKPVVDYSKQVSQDVNKKIDNSDNKTLKDGRQIASATWDATGNALSGLGKALSMVGDSASQNTKQCVEKRYGQDVTNTFMGPNQPYSQMTQVQAQNAYNQYAQQYGSMKQ